MTELGRFATHVLRICHEITAAHEAGDIKGADHLIAQLAALASDVAAKGEMQRDASDPDRYDLSTLPSPDGKTEPE